MTTPLKASAWKLRQWIHRGIVDDFPEVIGLFWDV